MDETETGTPADTTAAARVLGALEELEGQGLEGEALVDAVRLVLELGDRDLVGQVDRARARALESEAEAARLRDVVDSTIAALTAHDWNATTDPAWLARQIAENLASQLGIILATPAPVATALPAAKRPQGFERLRHGGLHGRLPAADPRKGADRD